MPPESFGKYPVPFYLHVLWYCEAVIFSLLPELRVAGVVVKNFSNALSRKRREVWSDCELRTATGTAS